MNVLLFNFYLPVCLELLIGLFFVAPVMGPPRSRTTSEVVRRPRKSSKTRSAKTSRVAQEKPTRKSPRFRSMERRSSDEIIVVDDDLDHYDSLEDVVCSTSLA